jgi:hypothetical protein
MGFCEDLPGGAEELSGSAEQRPACGALASGYANHSAQCAKQCSPCGRPISASAVPHSDDPRASSSSTAADGNDAAMVISVLKHYSRIGLDSQERHSKMFKQIGEPACT